MAENADRDVAGGVATVLPRVPLLDASRLDFGDWKDAAGQAANFTLNRSFGRWAEEAGPAAEPRPAWIAHDAGWQYPVITEQHAFRRMRGLLPAELDRRESVYLAFPFATLIDLHMKLGPSHHRTRDLQCRLDELAPRLRRYERVITVAQHILARRFLRLFAEAGVTDIFWSHCVTGENAPREASLVRLHPFPLYPVQQVPRGRSDFERSRRWLFSFVGARAAKPYLTDTRNRIIETLGSHPCGKVVARNVWHFQRIVYDAQVLGRIEEGAPGLVNDDDAAAFREIMDESIFTLCPSGSGPNSIRLWEAILNGSVPVILSDAWAAPGDQALWRAATIRCSETPEAIAALPDRLARLVADPERMRGMRAALLDLAGRYGPDGFVTDIIRLMAAPAPGAVPIGAPQPMAATNLPR